MVKQQDRSLKFRRQLLELLCEAHHLATVILVSAEHECSVVNNDKPDVAVLLLCVFTHPPEFGVSNRVVPIFMNERRIIVAFEMSDI